MQRITRFTIMVRSCSIFNISNVTSNYRLNRNQCCPRSDVPLRGTSDLAHYCELSQSEITNFIVMVTICSSFKIKRNTHATLIFASISDGPDQLPPLRGASDLQHHFYIHVHIYQGNLQSWLRVVYH